MSAKRSRPALSLPWVGLSTEEDSSATASAKVVVAPAQGRTFDTTTSVRSDLTGSAIRKDGHKLLYWLLVGAAIFVVILYVAYRYIKVKNETNTE